MGFTPPGRCPGCLGPGSAHGTYVQPGAAKDALLHPAVLSPAVSNKSSLLLGSPHPPSSLRAQPEPQPTTFLGCNRSRNYDHDYDHVYLVDECGRQLSCSGCRSYVTGTRGTACPSCGSHMSKELKLVPSAVPGRSAAQEAGGVAGKVFVQGIVTYTVMDDLTVTPMSSISSITLLNTFGVRDLGALQEKTVQLGYNEGLDILKASLQSKTVLTDVFLKPSNV